MTMRSLAAAMAALAGLGTAAGALAAEDEAAALARLRQERTELESRIDQLRRRVPPESEAKNARQLLRRASETAVAGFEVEVVPGSEAVPFEDGRPSTLRALRLDVAGRGAPFDLGTFFARVGILDYWLRDLESLEAEGAGDEELSFRARFVFLVEAAPGAQATAAAPLPPLAEAAAEVEALRARERLLDAWGARTDDGRVHAAARLFEAFAAPMAAVRLTRLRLDGGLVLEGVALGAAARAALLATVEGAGYAPARLETPAAGACRPFVLAARPGPGGGAPERVAGPGGEGAAALCAEEAAPAPGRIAVRGGSGGALALRLRGVAVPDLFAVLHELTGEGFVVDADVGGRADVEIEAATLEEVLAALRVSGLAVGEPPLRRVSRAPVTAPAETYTGEPLRLSFQDANLAEVLCLFEEITGLKMRVAEGVAARVHVHAHDVPWDQAFEAIVAAAGLSRAIDGTDVFVGPAAALAARGRSYWPDACGGIAAGTPLGALRPPAAELGVEDLTFAGVAGDGTTLRGYAYGAWRRLLRLAPGDRLFDATVRSVDPQGVVVVRQGGGTVRLAPAP